MNRFERIAHEHFDELVLDKFEVVKVSGFLAGDGENFWIFRKADNTQYYATCENSFIPLKKSLGLKYIELEKRFYSVKELPIKELASLPMKDEMVTTELVELEVKEPPKHKRIKSKLVNKILHPEFDEQDEDIKD